VGVTNLFVKYLWRTGLKTLVTAMAKESKAAIKRHLKSQRNQIVDVLTERSKVLEKDIKTLKIKEQSLAQLVKEFGKKQTLLEGELHRLQEARRLDYEQYQRTAALDNQLRLPAIETHVRSSVSESVVDTVPFPNLVVPNLFPGEFYGLLLQALPPEGFWIAGQPGRENWKIEKDVAPRFSEMVWSFVNRVGSELLVPLFLSKFETHIERFYGTVFGAEAGVRLGDLSYEISDGRLMLRRPGYHIAPHVDPFRAMLTVLFYLAKPGDSELYGTTLCRASEELPAERKGIDYPEKRGIVCESVKTISYQPNSALVFLSPRSVHGADIPDDADAGVERHALQFYVALRGESRGRLLKAARAAQSEETVLG